MTTYHLNNVGPCFYFDKPRLSGTRKEDNKDVITSPVESHNGNEVITHSNNTYILLSPSLEHMKLCKRHDVTIDTDNLYASILELHEKMNID